MRTMHGMHVHGFPNAFQVQAAQAAALISNYPHNLTEAGRTIGEDISAVHGIKMGGDCYGYFYDIHPRDVRIGFSPSK
jgi:cyclohexanone monooxygenase